MHCRLPCNAAETKSHWRREDEKKETGFVFQLANLNEKLILLDYFITTHFYSFSFGLCVRNIYFYCWEQKEGYERDLTIKNPRVIFLTSCVEEMSGWQRQFHKWRNLHDVNGNNNNKNDRENLSHCCFLGFFLLELLSPFLFFLPCFFFKGNHLENQINFPIDSLIFHYSVKWVWTF